MDCMSDSATASTRSSSPHWPTNWIPTGLRSASSPPVHPSGRRLENDSGSEEDVGGGKKGTVMAGSPARLAGTRRVSWDQASVILVDASGSCWEVGVGREGAGERDVGRMSRSMPSSFGVCRITAGEEAIVESVGGNGEVEGGGETRGEGRRKRRSKLLRSRRRTFCACKKKLSNALPSRYRPSQFPSSTAEGRRGDGLGGEGVGAEEDPTFDLVPEPLRPRRRVHPARRLALPTRDVLLRPKACPSCISQMSKMREEAEGKGPYLTPSNFAKLLAASALART